MDPRASTHRPGTAIRCALACVGLLASAAVATPALGAGEDEGAPVTPTDDATELAGEEYVPGELLVRVRGQEEATVEIPPGTDPAQVAERIERDDDVAYAAPNYVAHVTGRMIPNDPGSTGGAGGWTASQWNFLGGEGGIGAPLAWDALRDAGMPGGAPPGRAPAPIVAVLDTGIAYTSSDPFDRSPDFRPLQFEPGRDFVDGDAVPADENGHGTHIAGTIAAQVDDSAGFTGLAYGTRLLPVRVLDESGAGSADDIRAAILWAVDAGADLINLSLEFDQGVADCDQIPGICNAIKQARERRVAVIAAAGNGGVDGIGDAQVALPARAAFAIGGTTVRSCLARYSNFGEGLDMVAPGGGRDALLTAEPCMPVATDNPDIVQLSLLSGGGFTNFGPVSEHGTSMAAAHVTGVAALVLATRQLNRHGKPPTVGRLEEHLQETARPLGDELHYGAGLLSARRAVKPRRN